MLMFVVTLLALISIEFVAHRKFFVAQYKLDPIMWNPQKNSWDPTGRKR
jgi:hypothetical protein